MRSGHILRLFSSYRFVHRVRYPDILRLLRDRQKIKFSLFAAQTIYLGYSF